MKKSHLPMVVCLILLTGAPLHAQTAEESAAWLQSKLRTYVFIPGYSTSVSVSASSAVLPRGGDEVTETKDGVTHIIKVLTNYSRVRFSDVTDVVKVTNPHYSTSVRLTGHFLLCWTNTTDHPLGCFSSLNADFFFSDSTPSDEIDRIVKAIRHLAQLNGAKLVDDDLFK